MRVARAGQSLDDRRRVVVDLLKFIHDFNQLDTTLLIAKVYDSDMKFVEAAEAVLQSAVGPSRSIEALRDFAVQALTGEKPLPVREMDRIRPQHRVTPFSVPYELLRAIVPHRGQFDPHRLRSLNKTDMLELPSTRPEWTHAVSQDQWWLVTTIWVRAVPYRPALQRVRLDIRDQGSQRILHEGPLGVLLEEPMPCFWPFPPNSYLRLLFRGYDEQTPSECRDPTTLLMAIEGWSYHLG